MPSDNPNDLEKKVLDIVQEATVIDKNMREKYQVGDKFRFVRDRLNALLEELKQSVETHSVVKRESKLNLELDEALVFVHLFNVQGLNLRTWHNMLTPKVLYEYSVNRPIYTDKIQIDSLVRSKSNKLQHGYLTIAVKKTDLIESQEGSILKDAVGNPIIKVREGALKFEKIVNFSHNEIDYLVGKDEGLIKQESVK